MKESILHTTDTWMIALILFILILIFFRIGIYFAKLRKVDKNSDESNSALTTSIYAVMGLMLAFTFSMAGSRFDSRKKIIVDEANCIGTAVLRADMYQDSVRVLFREDFKNYLEARIDYFEFHRDLPKVKESLQRSEIYSAKLWARAAELSKNTVLMPQTNQMIPALNAMFDIANSRLHDELYRLPDIIMIMLFSVVLIACYLFGYTSVGYGKLDWYLAVCFAGMIVFVIYIILDLDKPRSGFINLDDTQQAIVVLRKMFE